MERTENPLPHWPRGEVQKMKVGVFWWTSPAALVKAWRLVKETVRAAINDWHEEILLECHSLGAKKGSPEYLAAAHEDGRPLSPNCQQSKHRCWGPQQMTRCFSPVEPIVPPRPTPGLRSSHPGPHPPPLSAYIRTIIRG